MLGFEKYEAPMRGLNKVIINSIGFKTNSRGEYIDIEVSKNGKVKHIFNNINSDTRNYVIAQVCNLATQLHLNDCTEAELYELVKGKEAEIEITESGFHINPYTTTVVEEAVEV